MKTKTNETKYFYKDSFLLYIHVCVVKIDRVFRNRILPILAECEKEQVKFKPDIASVFSTYWLLYLAWRNVI